MKEGLFKSLKTILAVTVVGIVTFLNVILLIVAYNVCYDAVERSYLNQLKNFNKEIESQLVSFYNRQVKIVKFLAKESVIVNAVKTGNYGAAQAFMRNYYNESGILENIFISTADKNTVIITDGIGGKSIGQHGTGKTFADNLSHTLDGKIYVGDPYKSPVTGLPVVLITVPITDGGKVAGIFGYALNIGELSNEIVKNIKIGKTGYPFLCDNNGLTFAHPTKENIFKLDLSKFEWAKKMLVAESGTVFRYQWEGKDKILTFVRNKEYRFLSAATIYAADINEDARTMAIIMVVCGLVGSGIVGAVIYLFISRRLSPLDECKAVMADMAEGNLASRYKGRMSGDEIGDIARSLNGSLEQSERLISEIITAVQNLAQAVEQISSGNQNLSQRTSEQASSLEEIASTIEEAAATINQNAENASRARELTDTGSVKSTEGNRIALEAVISIKEMNESSRRVGDIIAMINEIAFQTNLLALNAAVEAARAGEQGRGFAVVAGEVRNLAQRSGNAAKEIEGLIKDTVNKVERSTELVNRTGDSLNEIAEAGKMSAQIIEEIASASMEQKQGINQINNAIAEMDNMTQQNASLVEETASASEEMANQAQELLEMVRQFKISDAVNGTISSQHKAIHLKAAERLHTNFTDAKKPGNGDGRKQTGLAAEEADKLKEMLKYDGFQEF